MSSDKEKDPARGWQFVEKLIDKEEDERLEKLPEEERLAEMRKAGAKAGADWDAGELLAMATVRAAKAPPPPVRVITPVVPIRRRWPTAVLVAAAFLGGYVIYVATKKPDGVAHPRPANVEADDDRKLAEARCAIKDWRACKTYLDEAAKLDPAGEAEPLAEKVRAALAAGVAGEAGVP